MADERPSATAGLSGKQVGIVAALQQLTDGLYRLFSQHIELVGLEMKRDLAHMGRDVGVLLGFSAIMLIGYALLNVSAVLWAGLIMGTLSMAITASLLAAINLGFGVVAVRAFAKRVQAGRWMLPVTSEELERSKKWAKTIREH